MPRAVARERAAMLERARTQAERDGRFAEAVRLALPRRGGASRRAGRRSAGALDAQRASWRASLRSADFDALAQRFDEIAYGSAPAAPADAEDARSALARRAERRRVSATATVAPPRPALARPSAARGWPRRRCVVGAFLALALLAEAFAPAPQGRPARRTRHVRRASAAWAQLLARDGHPVLQLRAPAGRRDPPAARPRSSCSTRRASAHAAARTSTASCAPAGGW